MFTQLDHALMLHWMRSPTEGLHSSVALIGCVSIGVIVVLQRKPSIVQAAPVAYDVGRYDERDEVIEG